MDVNQGYTLETLRAVLPALVRNRVALIEQPLPRGHEAELGRIFVAYSPGGPDESAPIQSSADLPGLVGRFQVINVKLDKCGGLTEGLAIVRRARQLGFELMVGNMAGSSWAMAAGCVVGQACKIVDLDGPLALSADRTPAVTYRDGKIWSDATVWGAGTPAADAPAHLVSTAVI